MHVYCRWELLIINRMLLLMSCFEFIFGPCPLLSGQSNQIQLNQRFTDIYLFISFLLVFMFGLFEQLLGRAFSILRENNPELARDRRRTVMSPPQVMREGIKKTVLANFTDLYKT